MSQNLRNAVDSLTREIERLSQVRDQLVLLAGGSKAGAHGTGRNAARAGVVTAGKGRKPVSEATRKKMADARRAYFAAKRKNKPRESASVAKKSAGRTKRSSAEAAA